MLTSFILFIYFILLLFFFQIKNRFVCAQKIFSDLQTIVCQARFWKVWFGIPQISKKDVDKNVAIKMVYF